MAGFRVAEPRGLELDRAVPPRVRRQTLTTPEYLRACVARCAAPLRDSQWTRHGSYAEVLAELDRLPDEFKAKPECQEVRDLVARAQRLSVVKWKCEILK